MNLRFSKLLLICNNRTYSTLTRYVDNLNPQLKKNITVINLDFSFQSLLVLRTLNSITKLQNYSKFALAKNFRLWSRKEISTLNVILRFFFYILTYKNRGFAKLVRYLFLERMFRVEILDQLGEYKNYDLILTLSLTDDLDTLLVGFGKKYGIKTIGTVRSWDNLSSHGLLRVEPDIFYSHSEAMKKDLVKYQFYSKSKNSIYLGVSYWVDFEKIHKFKEKHNNSGTRNRKILYGAMGHDFNPSEGLLLSRIYGELTKDNLDKIEFAVLMHPRFPISRLMQSEYSDKMTFFSFDFDNLVETKSYHDYVEFLSGYEYIFSSGSTLLLDASQLNVEIFHLNFDLLKVSYWQSSKRYLDYREYYKNFIKLAGVQVLDSYEQLVSILIKDVEKPGNFSNQQELAFGYIMGISNRNSLIALINDDFNEN